jgi:hypothetical protein
MGGVVKSVTKGAGKVVKSVLGIETPQTPEPVAAVLAAPPVVESPKAMPVPDDAAARNAQRKSVADQRRRRGRSSTILTAADESLGG